MTRAGSRSVTEFRFVLPQRLEASGPPEERGVLRDSVKLLVSDRGKLVHSTFHDFRAFSGRATWWW